MSRTLSPPGCALDVSAIRTQFYKEEFLKYQRCITEQREYYSERTIGDIQSALSRLIARVDALCGQDDADEIISELLKQLDVVTGLSAWPNSQKAH